MKNKLWIAILTVILVTSSGCGGHTHKYDAWETTKQPSCTEEGVRTRKCSKCGEVEEDSVPAQGHNFVNGSCTECGKEE